MEKKLSTVITTFGSDIYIISNKTADQVSSLIETGGDMVRMPNGARVNKKAIATIQDHEDYTFQAEQKMRHKKGQYIRRDEWYDNQGPLGLDARLERITGNLEKLQIPVNKSLNLHD